MHLGSLGLVAFGLTAALLPVAPAGAQDTFDLGTAADFVVLAGSTVTNTGPTVLTGDVGVSPGSAIVGFPPGIINGDAHAADGDASLAQVDLTAAYDDLAASPTVSTIPTELGGTTLTPGTYDSASGTFEITGTLTLDTLGDPFAEFVFKTASTLITASGSNIVFAGAAPTCGVYWQVGSSATLGTGSDFVGNIVALTSITVTTGTDVVGRLLARNGAVTLDTNTALPSACAEPLPPPPPPPAGVTTTTAALPPTTVTTLPVAGDPTTTTEAAPATTTATTRPPLPNTGSDGRLPLVGFLTLAAGASLTGLSVLGRRRWTR